MSRFLIHLVNIICLFMIATTAYPASSDCTHAAPNHTKFFCGSFKEAAICHCSAKVPRFLCQNMQSLYSRMLFFYGSLENACGSQKVTSKQNCMDDWNCYKNGGMNASGRLCNTTGRACEKED